MDAFVIGASGSVVDGVCAALGACGATTRSIAPARRSTERSRRVEDEEEEEEVGDGTKQTEQEEEDEDAAVIAQSRFVLVCVTRELFNRVDGKAENDACRSSFREAWRRKGRYLVPMVMEPDLLDRAAWPAGLVKTVLGRVPGFDASSAEQVAGTSRLALAAREVYRQRILRWDHELEHL